MMQKPLAILLLGLYSAAAMSQGVIGTVDTVKGLVTVSDANSVNTAVPGMSITDGARLVASSSGTATITINRNCHLTLEPNQSVTVSQDKSCNQMVAAIQTLPAAGTGVAAAPGAAGGAAGTAAAGGGSGLIVPLIGIAAVSAIVIANNTNRSAPISGQ